MKFNNTHNEKVVLPLPFWKNVVNAILNKMRYQPRTIWLSRSVAVVASIVVIKDETPYLLINQRGKGSADFQGLWNLPCGYLDYDETTGEATMREVWEECGVNLKSLKDVRFDFLEKPWDTNSSPNENRQNVTFHHGIIAHVDELPSTSLENNEPDEVAEVRWIPIDEYKDYSYAFNHQNRITKFLKHTLLDIHLSKKNRDELQDSTEVNSLLSI
jgi:8-oxo-dGTP pyrophosphatase MutT (NUDIX family)